MSFVTSMGQDFILKPPAAATQSFPRRSNNNLILACWQLGSSLHIKEQKRANCMGISLIFAPKLGKNRRVETQATSLQHVFPHWYIKLQKQIFTSTNEQEQSVASHSGKYREEEIRRNALFNYCRLKEVVWT